MQKCRITKQDESPVLVYDINMHEISNEPLVSINIVVWNITKFGEGRYTIPCLDSIRKQSYKNIEVTIVDNNSSDTTREIIEKNYPEYRLIKNNNNPGLWATQEMAFSKTNGKYILALSLDTILDSNFIKNSVEIFEKDEKIGAIQAKIYSYSSQKQEKKIIDTVGFKIYRNRRLINEGHGEEDLGQYENEKEIFGVEGAVPMFRRSTLEDIKIDGKFADTDYFWYGDDFDMAWRINLFGWKQIYNPNVIAYHDRSTTKDISKGGIDYLARIKKRSLIPIKKRQLDWANSRFTIIKNDYIVNIIRDLPRIIIREFSVFVYSLLFEPKTFLIFPSFIKLLPAMLRKRKEVMKKTRVSPTQIRKWFK